MNASWSMVFGALLAGTVAGFMIPVRPEIRDVPALTASRATEPATTSMDDKTATPVAAKPEDTPAVRQIPLTAAASKAGPQEKTSEATTAAAPGPAEIAGPGTEPVKPEQKTAAAPPAREERTERPAPAREERAEPQAPAGQAAARSGDEPRAQSVNERQEARPARQPRRAARRAHRNTVDFNDGIPTRIYLRGPDGRLYLAPEYQPSGRPIYFVR